MAGAPREKRRLTFDHPQIGITIPSGMHGNVSVPCPKCQNERKKKHTKTLYVDVNEGVWTCMHCGRTGSLVRGWVEDPVPFDDTGAVYEAPQRKYTKPPAVPATVPINQWHRVVAWAATRKITEATLARNRVTVKPMYCPVCEEERNMVGMPYYRNGEHVNTKWRCPHKHFRMEKDAERILYGYDDVVSTRVDAREPIIIVEGEFDKFALEECGYRKVLSVPNGAPAITTKNYDTALAFLNDDAMQKAFETASAIIIAVDEDAPGEKLRDELIRRCRPERVRVVTWPDGIKDANDALKEMGVDAVRASIDAATPPPVEGIVTPEMLSAQIDLYYREGLPRGVSFGWPELDPYITMMPGGFYIVQAIPQSGKSAFTTALLLNLAEQSGWPFAVFSPENQPVAVHEIAMLETITGKPFEGDGRMTVEERIRAETWLQRYGTFIMPEKKDVGTILDRARALVFQRGIRVLVIDPWTEIEHESQKSPDKLAYIGASLTRIREFGQRHKVAVILVAHPTKPQRKVLEDGRVKYEPVGMYGASGSADFANKADFIVELEREGGDDPGVHIHIEKVRFKWTGKQGSVTLYFDRATGRYSGRRQYDAYPAGG